MIAAWTRGVSEEAVGMKGSAMGRMRSVTG